jgi:hypothetical protein
VATKEPTKAFIVSQTKRANNRLKVIGETCLNLVQGRDTRSPERVHKQTNVRLERELAPSDTAGPALRDAVETFWQRGDEDSAMAVREQVRQVQSDRWRQVEAKHGKISHDLLQRLSRRVFKEGEFFFPGGKPMVHPKNIREFLTCCMIFLLAIQRQIPDLAHIAGELAHLAKLLPVRFYLEFVGLQTFHSHIILGLWKKKRYPT